MKNLKLKTMKMLLMLFCLIGYLGFGQTSNESKILCVSVDEFTDDKSIDAGSTICYKDGGDMKTEGILFMAFLKEEKGKYGFSTLYAQVYGMDGCVDKGSTLDIIFENGEKTQLVNWNDFDCKGKNYFRLSKKQIALFKNNDLKAMKYTNTRSYKSMIIKDNLDSESKSYLRNLLVEIDKINDGLTTIPICEKD